MLNISDFPWAEFSPVDHRVMYISDSLSLKRSTRDTGVLRYDFELVTYSMSLSEGRKFKAKLSRATKDVLLFVHPQLSYSQGTIPQSGIKVFGSQIKGVDEIQLTSVDDWQLFSGDYLQFSNDTKVYEVAEDTLLQSGVQSVKLTGQLRNSLTADSDVTTNDITWHLISNGIIETNMIASDGQDIQLTLVAVEKL